MKVTEICVCGTPALAHNESIHACPHINIEHQPADPAVGITNESWYCEDCGSDMTTIVRAGIGSEY